MQNPITSTSVRVDRTRLSSRSPSSVRGLCRPGVSTRISCASGRCTMPRITRRVVCGRSLVIATLAPTSALVSVDLPTLGRPARQANPERNAGADGGSFTRQFSRMSARAGTTARSASIKATERSGATVVPCPDSGRPRGCSCSTRRGGSCCSARPTRGVRSGSRRAAGCTAGRAWRPPRSGNWPRRPATSGPRPTSGRWWRRAPGCGRPRTAAPSSARMRSSWSGWPEPRVDTDGQEALERSVITGHRWWTTGELRATGDKIVPAGLSDLVDRLLSDGVPATPVRLPWGPNGCQASGGRCRRGRRGTPVASGPRSRTTARSPGSSSAVADQRGRLELLRAAGDRHGHGQAQRRQPQRRQGHRRGRVGAAGLVADRRALGRRHPRPGGPGQGDDLEVFLARESHRSPC